MWQDTCMPHLSGDLGLRYISGEMKRARHSMGPTHICSSVLEIKRLELEMNEGGNRATGKTRMPVERYPPSTSGRHLELVKETYVADSPTGRSTACKAAGSLLDSSGARSIGR